MAVYALLGNDCSRQTESAVAFVFVELFYFVFHFVWLCFKVEIKFWSHYMYFLNMF